MPKTYPRIRLSVGTRARALAQYVVQENPLPMVADLPVNYLGAKGWDFVRTVPTAWDETRVLWGEVGHGVVIARRKGAEWWLGAITDAHARTVRVPLPALAPGRYRIAAFEDAADAREGICATMASAAPGNALTIPLNRAGGYAARITPERAGR